METFCVIKKERMRKWKKENPFETKVKIICQFIYFDKVVNETDKK